MVADCFDRFMTLYDKGDITGAVQQVLSSPCVAYDSLPSNIKYFHYLENYIDAISYRGLTEARFASLCLLALLDQDPEVMTPYPNALTQLKIEQEMLKATTESQAQPLPDPVIQLLSLLQNNAPLQTEITQSLLSGMPAHFRRHLEHQIPMIHGWNTLQSRKQQTTSLYVKGISPLSRPWHPLRYPIPPQPIEDLDSNKTPLVFLEPIDSDYSTVLNILQDHPALFVFNTRIALIQMLQYPEVVKSLCAPHHLIYILELYPNQQLAQQDRSHLLGASFKPLLTTENPLLTATLPVLLEAVTAFTQQPEGVLGGDTEAGDRLYHIAKRMLFASQEQRLGMSRIPGLIDRISIDQWFDPHKNPPPKGMDLGPEPPDLMGRKLAQVAQKRLIRSKKLRLVHIVPQVVDGGHAPSRLLESLIQYHDRDRFDLFLIVTERYQYRPLEYPHAFGNSAPTRERAPYRLGKFQQEDVKINILSTHFTLEKAAQDAAFIMSQVRADIAVFHGPDVINSMCALLTDVSTKILFEHGTPPAYPGFDLVIASAPGADDLYRDLFAKLKVKAKVLPFAIDVRADWKPTPFPREELGLIEDCRVMTTISNHLANRLGDEMCLAIAEILQRTPNAFYVPIGRIEDEGKFLRFFRKFQVDHRVLFLGAVNHPSQYARSMDLYLNEFPFGSCLGMLDAMAAGCPIVSMYDPNGPPQARYGGHYFGIDRSITSGKREDYVNLACRLLQDPEMHREWSEYAIKQFEKHADVPTYVKAFEAIVLEMFSTT